MSALLERLFLGVLVAIGAVLCLGGLVMIWLGALALLPGEGQRAAASVVLLAVAFAGALSLFDPGRRGA